MSREAMQMALEALDSDNPDIQLRAAATLRQAHSLTDELMDCVDRLGSEADTVDPRVWQHLLVYAPKPEEEPVAWISEGGDVSRSKRYMDEMGFKCNPLYTAPPKREWVGLTDDEIMEPWPFENRIAFARWLESKIKEKNTGISKS